MEENFRALFVAAQQKSASTLLVEAARTARYLIETGRENILLHGDVHHLNFLKSAHGDWVVIDPVGLVGERAYDFANVFYNPDDIPGLVETPDRILMTARIFSEYFKMDSNRILKFAFAFGCLSACWAREDGWDPARRMRIAKMIHGIL